MAVVLPWETYPAEYWLLVLLQNVENDFQYHRSIWSGTNCPGAIWKSVARLYQRTLYKDTIQCDRKFPTSSQPWSSQPWSCTIKHTIDRKPNEKCALCTYSELIPHALRTWPNHNRRTLYPKCRQLEKRHRRTYTSYFLCYYPSRNWGTIRAWLNLRLKFVSISMDIKYAQERIKVASAWDLATPPIIPLKNLMEQRGTGLTVARTNALPACCIDPDDVLQHSNIFAS